MRRQALRTGSFRQEPLWAHSAQSFCSLEGSCRPAACGCVRCPAGKKCKEARRWRVPPSRSSTARWPFHVITLAARGGVTYRARRVRNYRDYLEIDKSFAYLSWLYQSNRGVLMAPGAEENWTLSVQHSIEDVQRYVDNFAEIGPRPTPVARPLDKDGPSHRARPAF